MPGLAQTTSSSSLSCSINCGEFWSKHRSDDVIGFNQLQKFWSDLSPQARQKLLLIDKLTLFERARKSMYCSRCNGLLLEGFSQIVMYGKSMQMEGGATHIQCDRLGSTDTSNGFQEDIQDPSLHPWGGLATTRDGALTVLDCYLYSKNLKGLQNVFDSARARERERELLYPDACGGGGRGWISQGMTGYGRVHGTRESCALHTARLSCDTLVDFWSALGEETRQSLLRMKEEDFIERLMYRFDSKRFCRDCRRNVIREFKELKELKRMRREPRCTNWFCVADTAFKYEVSDNTIQADWHQTFADSVGTYHHFEWAVGTGEGESDIRAFENVGMNESVQVGGLDLNRLSSCFITLRAWKHDNRYSELSVKAHAVNGQQCVHSKLVVGDGFVTIISGQSIRRFFVHAEEAEEEEDDDSTDKDGNDLDGECFRPQKHAKSPELARKFLLDAATVIFKEQVEKAFREGTARQNAHSIFVCLSLRLLEERIHVACKEIITLEKQMKLLEEEEMEKREEEERKERRRTKEREKKNRRKERLKGKEKDKEKKHPDMEDTTNRPSDLKDTSVKGCDEEINDGNGFRDQVSEGGDFSLSTPGSPDIQYPESPNGYEASSLLQNDFYDSPDGGCVSVKDGAESFLVEQSEFYRRRSKFRKEVQFDTSFKWTDNRRSDSRQDDNFETAWSVGGSNRQCRTNGVKSNRQNSAVKFNEKCRCPGCRFNDRSDYHSCCGQNNAHKVKVEHVSSVRTDRDGKYVGKLNMRDGSARQKHKSFAGHLKKVWEPMVSQKRYLRNNLEAEVPDNDLSRSSGDSCSSEGIGDSGLVQLQENNSMKECRDSCPVLVENNMDDSCGITDGAYVEVSSHLVDNLASDGTSEPISTSSSNNCSPCLSEDSNSNSNSSNHGNIGSSSTSDSEDVGQHSEDRGSSLCTQNGFAENKISENGGEVFGVGTTVGKSADGLGMSVPGNLATYAARNPDEISPNVNIGSQHEHAFQSVHIPNVQYPVFQTPSTVGYYHQGPVSWTANPTNGLMPFSHSNHYLYTGPLGYKLNGNPSMCMQYSQVQHLPAPVFNSSPIPVYQPIARASGFCSEDQPRTCRLQEAANTGGRKLPSEGSLKREDDEKLGPRNTSFSLFHFGGPVALAAGSKTSVDAVVPSKEGNIGDFSSKFFVDRIENNGPCNKKRETKMEEYNLFAASNGIQFSLF